MKSTFYNGTEPYPQESVLKLSDSFKYQEADAGILGSQPQLELTVNIVNINSDAQYNGYLSQLKHRK